MRKTRRMRWMGWQIKAAVALAVLIGVLGMGVRVSSRERMSRAEEEAYYQTLEREVVRDVRDYLQQNGYEDSGVTLTRVVEADGQRLYTLTVHHKKITGLSGEEQEQLGETFYRFFFDDNDCYFDYRFI